MALEEGKDRRIVRSRKMIADAFLDILKKKAYSEISIVDIAEQANINRSTFYAHYLDKEDLLDRLVAEKLGHLQERIAQTAVEPDALSFFNESDPLFATLFEHASEHEQFYSLMLLNDASIGFRAKWNEMIRDAFFHRLSRLQMEQKLLVPLDFLLDYISSSTTGIIAKWLKDNRVYSPQYMALQLTRLASLGIYKTMGIS